MIYAFQDKENLYLVMKYFNGGDLRYYLQKKIKFNEQQTSNLIYNKY
jgi:serine/threonine protein kinase